MRKNSFFHEINIILEKMKSQIEILQFGSERYKNEDITGRLMQIIGSLSCSVLLESMNSERHLEGNSKVLGHGLEIGLSSVAVTKLHLLKCCAFFFKRWCGTLFIFMLASLVPRHLKFRHPCVLVYGAPIDNHPVDEVHQRLDEYCTHGPILRLKNDKNIVFRNGKTIFGKTKGRITLARNPLMTTTLLSLWSLTDIIYFLNLHLGNLFSFYFLVMKNPIFCLLYEDINDDALMSVLNKKGIVDLVIITNTDWFQQKIWMSCLPDKRFELHMALYSINNIPMIERQHSHSTMDYHPGFNFLMVDILYTWGEFYTSILQNLGVKTNCVEVGPVLWSLPSKTSPVDGQNVFRIAVFDVQPFIQKFVSDKVELNRYYSKTVNVKKFMGDITSVVKQCSVEKNIDLEIHYKSKREYNVTYDMEYLEFLSELEENESWFLRTDPMANLLDLIDKCDLIICLPFSSPAVISALRGKTSIFYDPTSKLHLPYELDNLYFCSSKGSLKSLISAFTETRNT